MEALIAEHATSLVGLALFAVLAWLLVKSLRAPGHGASMRVTAYCNHCNWEGTVVLGAMKCSRCRSTNLTVISTGARASR